MAWRQLGELKWLPIVVAAIVGIGLMFLLGIAFHADTFGMLLGIGFVCYFVTGLIAGAWANWRGWGHGGFAGVLLWVGNLIYSFVTGVAYGPLSQVPGFFLGVFMAGISGVAISTLAGFVGERIRR